MSDIKEPMYFSVDKNYKKGPDIYNNVFTQKAKKYTYYGESSTTYLASKMAVERMKKDLTNPKFIIILRNPVNRVYSHYKWMYSLNCEELPFKEAVIREFDNPYDPNKPYSNKGYKNYLEHSKYGTFVSIYINTFGFDNVFIVTTENLKSQPLITLNECFAFLGLRPLESINKKYKNITLKTGKDTTPLFLLILKSKVPEKVKSILNQKLKLNKKTENIFHSKKAHPPFNVSDRTWLKKLLYEEVELSKKVTGHDFKEWDDFN